MIRRAAVLLGLLALSACPDDPDFRGYVTADFFPFDGQVIGWTFGTRDDSIDFRIVQTYDPTETVTVDGQQRHTVRSTRRCLPEVEECGAGFVWAYTMSADSTRGVRIHAYETPESGLVELDPPLVIGPARSFPTQIARSEGVDGHTFTSEWIAIDARCDQSFEVDWDCAHFEITSDPPGHFLAGDWYAVPGYNVVSYQRSQDSSRWRLVELPRRP